MINPDIKIVRQLLAKGANPSYINAQLNKKTSQLALEYNQLEIATLLQKAENEYKPTTPNQSATESKPENKKEETSSSARIIRATASYSSISTSAQQIMDSHGSSALPNNDLEDKHTLFELSNLPGITDKERQDYLKRSAIAGHIIGQTLVLFDKKAKLSRSEKDLIENGLCAQNVNEILQISYPRDLKIMVMNTYIDLNCAKGNSQSVEVLIEKIKGTGDIPTFRAACFYFSEALMMREDHSDRIKALSFMKIAATLGHPNAKEIMHKIENATQQKSINKKR